MGGRPRDEDVKDEPDEDEAAMLGEGSSTGYSHRRQQSAGLGEAGGEAIMALATQEGEEAGSPAGAYESCHGLGLRLGASEQPAVAMPWLRGLEREMLDAGSLRTPGIGRMEHGLGG